MSAVRSRKRRNPTDPTVPLAKRLRHDAEVQAADTPRWNPINTVPQQKLQVFVFGSDTSGELGLGSKEATEVMRPRVNDKLEGVVGLATGGMHAAALTADGSVLTWGVNDLSALGRNTTWKPDEDDDIDLNPLETSPATIELDEASGDIKFVQVAACDSATLLLTENGHVYGCGTFRDHRGVVGFCVDITSKGHKLTMVQRRPRKIPGLRDIVSLSAGNDFVLALDTHGTVFAWGDGSSQQLGRRSSARQPAASSLMPAPVALPRSTVITSIYAGNYHAFAIDQHGDTWTWGLNNFGQTGIVESAGQDNAAVVLPQRVPALSSHRMSMLCGGQHHSLGITASGKCLAWGRMDAGQLGIPEAALPLNDPASVMTNDSGRPMILLRPAELLTPQCSSIAAGTDHSLVVTTNGEVFSFGFNTGGQCGHGHDDDVPVATVIQANAVRGKKIIWAGAGGQYSILATPVIDT